MRDVLTPLRRTCGRLAESAAALALAASAGCRPRDGPFPRYRVSTRPAIDSGVAADLDGSDVTFRGVPVDALSVSHVCFWNEGRARLRGSDVAAADPITVAVINGELLLDASVLDQSEPAAGVVLRRVPGVQAVRLGFAGLGTGQGCVVQILHTGHANDLAVSGTVAGFGGIDRATPHGELWLVLAAAAACTFAVGLAMAALVKAVASPPPVFVLAVGALGAVISLLVSRGALRLLARPGERAEFDETTVRALARSHLRRRVVESAGGGDGGRRPRPRRRAA